ncbi:MAG: hypothetical protein JSV57_01035 [Candidatus Bathyarchaeota archaeon]|nr:MAG: hypothetical protein JSV57_01035 [Candidatus Bathyarchaeota archaeon]
MLAELLLALITFVINSVFLTFYFSAVMLDRLSKRTLHVDALKIALPGTIIFSIFISLSPLVPPLTAYGPLSSSIDIGITAAAIVWVVLTKRYCESGWLSTIVVVAVAAVLCVIFMTFVDKFLALLEGSGMLA